MEMNIYWNDAGHMIKMAAMSKYGKIPLKIFPDTGWTISMKLDMLHLGLQPIKVGYLNTAPRKDQHKRLHESRFIEAWSLVFVWRDT